MSTSSLASITSDTSLSTRASSSNKEKLLEFDKCPRCRVLYDFLKRNTTTKVPLILNCKHTVCEDCIRRLCLANDAFCPICKEKISVPRNMVDSLPEFFTPHYSLIGYLMWTKNSPKKHFGNWVATGVTLKDKQGVSNDFDPMDIGDASDLSSIDFEHEKFYDTLEFEKCAEHKDNFKNIHCLVCQDVYCCYCFLIRHKGHDADYLWELTPGDTVDIEKLKNDIEIVLKHLYASYKKIKQLKIMDGSNAEGHVRKYFADLHAKLHLAEKNLRKNLQNWKPTAELDVKDLSDYVKLGINRAAQLLGYFNIANNQQINIRELCKEVKEIKQLPCRLVSENDVLEPVKFVCGSLENIEENFSLNNVDYLDYTLHAIEDWSAEEISSNRILPNRISNHEASTAKETKIEGAGSVVEVKRKEHQPPRKRSCEGGEIRIVLTHLNDLDSFFVRRYSNQEVVEQMNYNIGKREKRKLTVNDIRVGRTYGVLYEVSKGRSWRRGKLLEVISKETSVQCKMFYIDYGNTQLVTVDRLKELDLPIVKRSSYAFECKLTNPDQVVFEENSHLQLISIIEEKELYIQFIKKHRSGVQEVDLLLPTSKGSLLSVRDVILKNTTKPEKDAFLLCSESKLFPNSQRFQVGQEEDVIIAYIKDPYRIFVQMVKHYHFIQKLKEDIEQYYKNQINASFIPIEGSYAVVKYAHAEHGNWHRCEITSVNTETKQADVFFVDWGGSATVSWKDMKLLTQTFTKMECQSIAVRLAHIQRPNNGQWSQEAIDYLNEQVSCDKACKMVVSSANPLEVALFHCRPSANICLNSLLVENGHAVSVGDLSTTVCWPNEKPIDESEEDEDLASQMVKKSQEIVLEYSDTQFLKSKMRQQVTLVHYESPDLIYLKFSKFKDTDEEMHKELQIHYSKVRTKKDNCKNNEYCVIYDPEKKNYFRGVIKSNVGPDTYMVYLYDHVREVKVHKRSIFNLAPYFKRFVCKVWKCKLANIKPVGDGKCWSKIADEILLKIFANYKTIYVNKVAANIEEKKISVVMWYLLTTSPKALEPSKQHYVSINQSLVESGVAFSDKTLVNIPNGDDNNASSTSQIAEKLDDISTEKSSNKDWYEMICEDEAIHECPLKRWPASLSIEKKEFAAYLICIDSEGWFSLRDEELNEYYQTLEKNLNDTLDFLRPLNEESEDWKPNEMCTVLYEDKFYRGTILEVLSDDVISVEMIDFGSEHKVSRKDLSKHLMYPEVAPLLYKVQLYDVISGYGQLQGSDVEELLSIVSDEVTVVIKTEPKCDIPLAEIYLENGLSINDAITEKCPHLTRLKTVASKLDSSAEKTDDDYCVDDDTDKDKDDIDNFYYEYAPLPEGNGKHKMTLVNILKDKDQFRAVLSTVGNEVRLVDKEFVNLTSNMQNLVDEQPRLKDIELHKPCVCPHNDLWCRALVYDVEGIQHGYVLVLFVDYGTINMVNIENIKVMRPEWFDIPVYNLVATVNIKLKKKTMAEMVLMQLSNLRGKSVSVEIVSNDPLKIHLYDGETFYYQHFVDCNVVTAL